MSSGTLKPIFLVCVVADSSEVEQRVMAELREIVPTDEVTLDIKWKRTIQEAIAYLATTRQNVRLVVCWDIKPSRRIVEGGKSRMSDRLENLGERLFTAMRAVFIDTPVVVHRDPNHIFRSGLSLLMDGPDTQNSTMSTNLGPRITHMARHHVPSAPLSPPPAAA